MTQNQVSIKKRDPKFGQDDPKFSQQKKCDPKIGQGDPKLGQDDQKLGQRTKASSKIRLAYKSMIQNQVSKQNPDPRLGWKAKLITT